MGIKYTDVEIRWMSFELWKAPKTVSGKLTSEIGYHDPALKNWNVIRPGPDFPMDEAFITALFMIPIDSVLNQLPSNQRTLGFLLDYMAYGMLGAQSPFISKLNFTYQNADTQAAITELSGTLTVSVPGRADIKQGLPVDSLTLPMAARAKITIETNAYKTFTWEGPVIGEVNITVKLKSNRTYTVD